MVRQTDWWELHFVADETVYVNASVGGDWYTVREGSEQSFTARLTDEGVLTVANGETHTVSSGELETYEETKVEQGGTLTVEQGGTLVTNGKAERWSRLDDYATHAGKVTTRADIDNVQSYTDQLPADAPIASLLVGIEPAGDLSGEPFDGVWAVVVGATDARTGRTGPIREPGTWHFTLDVYVLAPYSDHADVAAARAAHEVG